MDLNELAAQWRRKAAEIRAGSINVPAYGVGLAAGLESAADELEDWLMRHHVGPDPATVQRAAAVISARMARYWEHPNPKVTLEAYLGMTGQELADFKRSGVLSERIVRRFTASTTFPAKVRRQLGMDDGRQVLHLLSGDFLPAAGRRIMISVIGPAVFVLVAALVVIMIWREARKPGTGRGWGSV